MSYGQIHEKFWNDSKVRQLEPMERYLFIYLITNPHRHFSGIYYHRPSTMTEETDLDAKAVDKGLNRLEELGIIQYDGPTYTVWVKNMLNYSQGRDRKISLPQFKGIVKHLEGLEKSFVIHGFVEKYQDKFASTYDRQDDPKKQAEADALLSSLGSLANSCPSLPGQTPGQGEGEGEEEKKEKEKRKRRIDPIERAMHRGIDRGMQDKKEDTTKPLPKDDDMAPLAFESQAPVVSPKSGKKRRSTEQMCTELQAELKAKADPKCTNCNGIGYKENGANVTSCPCTLWQWRPDPFEGDAETWKSFAKMYQKEARLNCELCHGKGYGRRNGQYAPCPKCNPGMRIT